MTRQDLRDQGFLDLYASADLRKYGYQIRHWFNPKTKEYKIEFIKTHKGKLIDKTPRHSVVVSTHSEQVAFHRSIGAPVWLSPYEESQLKKFINGKITKYKGD
jgi:hypothetical protein